MTMSRINYNCINPCINKSLRTLQCITCHAHSGSYAKAPFFILTSIRFILRFSNVLISNQTNKAV